MTQADDLAPVVVDAAALQAVATRLLVNAGMVAESAAIAARVLVSTDLRGMHTHGVRLIGLYARRIHAGEIHGAAVPRVVREANGTALWDGDGGLGHVVSVKVVEETIRRMQSAHLGISMAVVRNSQHFGGGAYYALLGAEAGFIAIASTNSVPVMVPPGGRGRRLGNNPIAWGAPASREGGPFVFDIALSETAGGKVALANERGETLPGAWVVDAEGRPGSDPSAFSQGGALVPLGVHKGYGLALLIEILTGVLGGGGIATEVGLGDVSHVFILVDPQAFLPGDEFPERIGQLAKLMHESPRADGVERIYLPGERALEHQAQSLRDGLELDTVIWKEVKQAAAAFGCSGELQDAIRR